MAHERAHLRGHHAWVLWGVDGLETALPFIPAFRMARTEVACLLEMLADDEASRRHGHLMVASAVLRLGRERAPAGALGVGGARTADRVRRLLGGAPPLPLAVRAAGFLTAPVLVVTPFAVLAARC